MIGQTKFEDAAASLGAELAKAISKSMPVYTVLASVESVDEENKTINAIVDSDKVFSDISLNVFPGVGNSIYLVPTVGSLIVLGFIEGFAETPFILKTTGIDRFLIANQPQEKEEDNTSAINIDNDSIFFLRDNVSVMINNDVVEVNNQNTFWKIEKDKISLTSDKIEMDGGENDGLVLIKELTEKLNAFVDDFNNHQQEIPAGQVLISAQAGVPNPAPIPISLVKKQTAKFNKADYENTKITQ